MEQYNHLVQLLENHDISDKDHGHSSTGHALLAGKACLLSSISKEWYLDSGTTDHISPFSVNFDNLKPVTEPNSSITILDGSQIMSLMLAH